MAESLGPLRAWGSSSLPPVGLATLIMALHWRPFQGLPMFFAASLAFSSYVNVAGFTIDSAGMTAAWSGMYVLLAARRRPQTLAANFKARFSPRGLARGGAMGLGAANMVAGGYVYATGDRELERASGNRDRWNAKSNK